MSIISTYFVSLSHFWCLHSCAFTFFTSFPQNRQICNSEACDLFMWWIKSSICSYNTRICILIRNCYEFAYCASSSCLRSCISRDRCCTRRNNPIDGSSCVPPMLELYMFFYTCCIRFSMHINYVILNLLRVIESLFVKRTSVSDIIQYLIYLDFALFCNNWFNSLFNETVWKFIFEIFRFLVEFCKFLELMWMKKLCFLWFFQMNFWFCGIRPWNLIWYFIFLLIL